MTPTPYVVQLDGVSKHFGSFQALRDISLSVVAGEKVVICGPSGSGKSTLIRCINRLERHETGTITVGGRDITDGTQDLQSIRSEIGMVFQSFNLFPHLTVLDNLTLGPRRVRRMSQTEAVDLAMHFLERVRIPEQAKKYPSQLSGGQQQRVAIARSLCMKPKLMLFDEPTSALDPEMINEVLEVMEQLAFDGMTMLVVTHEMGFAKRVADSMVFMDKGEIVEKAAPATFFSNPRTERCQRFLKQILAH
ncbi:MAG: amino acid transporter ATP-binding protein [Polaromonas sp.]|nr:amino acid transporter ATP-binding protein [Polaromonas sp.]